MGLFGKVFSTESCVICSNECDVMHRVKTKDKDYVCSDCERKCSNFVRVPELSNDEVVNHIEYMKKQENLYQLCFSGAKKCTFPPNPRAQAISFADEIGMFEIVGRDGTERKEYHELFRYDQVLSYEKCVETEQATEPGKPDTFKWSGVRIRLVSMMDRVELNMDTMRKGLRAHPYVRREIEILFHTSEKEADYTGSAIAHFDYIFGANDNESALFSIGMNKTEKRNVNAMEDAQGCDLAEFTRRADAAESKAYSY